MEIKKEIKILLWIVVYFGLLFFCRLKVRGLQLPLMPLLIW